MDRRLVVSAVLLVLAVSVASVRASDTVIVVSDSLEVTVYGEAELSGTYRVDSDGGISLPTVGSIKVIGLTTSDAAAAITKILQKVMYDPHVAVKLLGPEKIGVSVSGEVKQTGSLSLSAGDRLLQAIVMAGYTETADLSQVIVFRKDQRIIVDLTKCMSGLDMSSNMELLPGDSILVQRTSSIQAVLVLGKVERQGAVPFRSGLTLTEALAMAGGVTASADVSKIKLKPAGTISESTVDYGKVLCGEIKEEIVLSAGDTVIVPEREKAFITLLGTIHRPGQYEILGKLNLSSALAMAGGHIEGSQIAKVQVLRTTGEKHESFIYDMNKIMSGKAEDPEILAGDTIMVNEKKPGRNILQILGSLSPFFWLFRR